MQRCVAGPVAAYSDRGIPFGWYRVAWASEVRADQVLSFRYFGRDLIAFSSVDGRAHVLSAHCAHLGAHLGTGRMVSDCVECPFHGWQWDADGRNVAIPYAERPSSRAIDTWTVDEVNGMVMVWYHPHGEPPEWRIPALQQYGSPEFLEYYPSHCRVWESVRVHPQQQVENTADPAHIQFVHHASDVPVVRDFGMDGAHFTVSLDYTWGGGKESTWLTPDGPVDGGFEGESWGLGYLLTTYAGIHPTVVLTGSTPIDEEHSDLYMAVLGGVRPLGRLSGDEAVARLANHFFEQVEADLPIWATQIYIERPAYQKYEGRVFAQLRKWADQFYVPGGSDAAR